MVQTTLFVNPTAGNDSGNGSQAARNPVPVVSTTGGLFLA